MNEKEKILTRIQWEKDKRRVAQGGFVPFCNAFGYELARHHAEIAKRLERTITEPNYNVMFLMPPGHAKSRYASILFPSYFLGKLPGKSIIMATHTAELSAKWGRASKRLIDDPKYQYVLGVKLKKDSQSSDRFDLSNGSEYFACGVGGTPTGHRSDLNILDDPIRSREDAESQNIRDKLWYWYLEDFCTRLKPGGSTIIMMTRRHEDDLVGRILNSKDKDNWDILSLPAIAEPNDILGRNAGEALWPDYITIEMLEHIRSTTDKRTWDSLYQQKPCADEGSYFKAEWIKTIEKLPPHLKIYGASDYAVTADRGDYTVHAVIGYDDKTDNIYIIDIWRAQEESNVWIQKFIDLCLKHAPLMWAEEGGQIMKSLNPFIEKEMMKRRCFTYRQQFTSMHDKTARARSFQAYMAEGRVFILNREWTDDLLLELLKFPAGKHDDQVDALGLIGRMLDEMIMSPAKNKSKTRFEYDKNMLILPGLQENISPVNTGGFRKL